MNKKLCVGEKNPAYRRHRISWLMLIEALITKEIFFWGGLMDPHTDVLREGGGVLKVMLERWNLAGSSGGTRNSQKKCQLLGVNFDWFMAILVLKKTKTNMVERWNFEGSSRRTRTSHQK